MGIRAAKKSTKPRGAKTTASGQPGEIDIGDEVSVWTIGNSQDRLTKGKIKAWDFHGCLYLIGSTNKLPYMVHWSKITQIEGTNTDR
jgi:hypothetical protein